MSRSTVFPGLWLHVEALIQLDALKVMETLREGFTTPEHAAFIQQLKARLGAP